MCATDCLCRFVAAALPAFRLCVERRSVSGRARYLAGLGLSAQRYGKSFRSPWALCC